MTHSSKKAHYDSMLYNYETTSKTDFREGQIVNNIPAVFKETPKRKPAPYNSRERVKYVGSMTDWKNQLPFGALNKPKDILQTDPRTPQEPYKCVEDLEREKVQQTRPRLVMTPAVSIDDMYGQARENLVKSMYTTEMAEKMKEAAPLCSNIKAPLPDLPAPAEPVCLPKLRPPYVPEEWRMDSVHWDRRQLRSSADATKFFWLRPEHKPFRCTSCEETAKVHAHRRRLQRY